MKEFACCVMLHSADEEVSCADAAAFIAIAAA
jgi:hypothetical protein